MNINYPLVYKGKVRDVYQLDDNHLLINCSDRISAFDYVFPTPIEGKGEVLNSVSRFWFNAIGEHFCKNHYHQAKKDWTDFFTDEERDGLVKTGMIVKKLKPIKFECIVRRWLFGSGYSDYKNGLYPFLPDGIQYGGKLDYAIFTPSTKEDIGKHDVNVSIDKMYVELGYPLGDKLVKASLEIFNYAYTRMMNSGLILADTKFEFGLDEDDNLVLMDELLTPDTCRILSMDDYVSSGTMRHMDKEIFRNYLRLIDWKPGQEHHLPEYIKSIIMDEYDDVLQQLIYYYITDAKNQR